MKIFFLLVLLFFDIENIFSQDFSFPKLSEFSHQNSILIEGNVESISILPECEYNFSNSKEDYPVGDWFTRSGTHWKFPSSKKILWIRFKINNLSSIEEDYYLINEYTFIDNMLLFQKTNSDHRYYNMGSNLSLKQKDVKYRLPITTINLAPGENYFVANIESKSGKFVSLKLESKNYFPIREKFPGYFFNSFASIIIIMIVISLYLFINSKDSINIYYISYLIFLVLYLFIWEGYGMVYLYPENTSIDLNILNFVGSLAGFSIVYLWRRMLLLSVQNPKIDKFLNAIGLLYLLSSIYSIFPNANFNYLDFTVYILPGLFIPTAIWTGIYSIKNNFSPAKYSIIGFIIFLLMVFLFFYSGLGFIPGIDITRNPLYIGYIFESFFFLLSILSRIQYRNEIKILNSNTNNLKADIKSLKEDKVIKNPARLKNINIVDLSKELNQLMIEEKIFCDDDLSLGRLSELLNISRHQLSELIGFLFQKNFYTYLNDHRINYASELLLQDHKKSILTIAMEVGYKSKSTFNKEFLNKYKITPSEYRKRNQHYK